MIPTASTSVAPLLEGGRLICTPRIRMPPAVRSVSVPEIMHDGVWNFAAHVVCIHFFSSMFQALLKPQAYPILIWASGSGACISRICLREIKLK